MKRQMFWLLPIVLCLLSCKKDISTSVISENSVVETVSQTDKKGFEIFPIQHATAVIQWDQKTIYIDPVGGAEKFKAYPDPDLILITDIHGDHLSLPTLEAIQTSRAKIIVPQAVADRIPEAFTPQLDILNNGDTKERFGFSVEAVPMYNLRKEDIQKHPKGRGNGYVIEKDGIRVYFSGDTEDIPEMRNLKAIDKAFVCMNLPYTMTVEKAADAVLDFKPVQVYPYHYRGKEGFSDVALFTSLVQQGNPDIEVIQLPWYPVTDD